MRLRAAALAASMLAFGALAPAALADGYESKPEAAERDPDYAAGKKAIAEKSWKEAIARFEQAARRDPDNPDLHNWLGYSHRNLKEYDLAFRHYNRAIELDPRHRGAHEYVGETYLLVGDPAGAAKHLAALREICLLPCDELADLERAIAKYSSVR
ncbi:MAG: tetratricopeptide repeat protein [Usitatibacter sp.]